ncbi:MAG: hypothetical protein K2H53_06320 [Clostridia bacterium]|nr:hypothetical protein [Clostridia bacterium]
MRKTKTLMKKMLSMQMIFIMALTMVINMNASSVSAYTVTHTQTKRTGIDAFPDSYKVKLQALANEHSNWTFTAFNTGISWSEFTSSETSTHLRNRVHNSSSATWKCSCGGSSGGYACASSGIIQYYADPRNFLTEDRNIPIHGNVI